MTLEPDRKDYSVQYTETEGGEWKGADVFADSYPAKQHADLLLRQHPSVRVVQTRHRVAKRRRHIFVGG